MEDRSSSGEKSKPRPWWYTLAVVGVVGAILLIIMGAILAGVAIPVYQSKIIAANEAAALQNIGGIDALQRRHRAERGNFASFDELAAAGGFDARFSGPSPVVEGYVFTLKVSPQTETQPAFYSINADPLQSEGFSATGRRHFYYDSEIVGIRTSEGRPATASDRPRE
jgi:hypothetical protein